MPQRIDKKKRSSVSLNRQQKSKSATRVFEQTTNSIHINPDQWLLPETEEYLRTNDNKKEKSISTIENEDKEQVVPIKKPLSPSNEVKLYLKKNSLVAKGLTIFDVLQPTSITVKDPHHIQVIDRYVLAKVWNDILPLTYGSYVNKFRLVNHYAVDLEKYEMKLKDLIKDYYQFLSKFIWKSLNDDQKRKLGPHIYWNSLSKEDQNKNAQEITKEEYKNQTALELFVWRKLTDDQQNDLLEKVPVYHEETQDLLKIALEEAENELALQGVQRMDVEIKRAIKFLQISTDLRQYQKRADNESKQKLDSKQISKRKSSIHKYMNQRVICRYDGDGYFYSGSLQKNSNGQSIILFDMDIEQETIGHIILPFNFNNQLNLFLQDCVLVRQLRETEEYWAPGLVLSLPSAFALPPNLYKIQIYDPLPRQIYVHRKDMIRISLSLFQRSVIYLRNINQKSITNGSIIHHEPETPSLNQTQIESILREILNPLTEKVESLNQSHEERYNQLLQTLDDHMNAIRILQERPYKPQMKYEYAQTIEIPTPPTTPSISAKSSSRISYSMTIEPGTIVYAIWSDDDGLAYQGTVLKSIDSNIYRIERNDLPGVKSNISRNDIFLQSNFCPLKNMDIQTFALIKYPNDSRHCYCPSVILRHRHSEPKTKVRFYDCYEKDLQNDQFVLPINEQQFERYTKLRIEKEKSLIKQVIVGLNNQTKTFMLGTIKDRVETGHQYLIEWFDKSENEQKEEHLFGAFTRRNKHYENAFVLAIDNNDKIYKPAKILSISNDQETIKVQYLNKNQKTLSTKIADVPSTTTFVITETYLDEIIDNLHI